MKKFLPALAFMILLCASALLTVSAQPPVAGGYRTIANDDEGAVAAANFAVDAQNKKAESGLKLLSIEKAQQQVVAGRNYSLCVKVSWGPPKYSTGDSAVTVFAKTVVYLNLKQEMSLTGWNTVENCSDSARTTAPFPIGEPISGGYGTIDNHSAEAVAAAKFAVAAKKKKDPALKLISIENAQQQVVAGMNYALCLKVHGKGDKAGKNHLVHTVVFLDLKQKMSVTSFETVTECKDE